MKYRRRDCPRIDYRSKLRNSIFRIFSRSTWAFMPLFELNLFNGNKRRITFVFVFIVFALDAWQLPLIPGGGFQGLGMLSRR